ncbi:MAG: four-carbon acid sugar kinase family protein [Arachnia sp.]
MLTAVLDDDPTGTQAASDVSVVLDLSPAAIREAFDASSSVYLQTNSRALARDQAVELCTRLREELDAIARHKAEPMTVVLRGDSTLRGHVFSESEVFLTPESLMVFVPAFPAGGRTTHEGIHYVEIEGRRIPAAETEFAADPVFGFRNSDLLGYVRDKGARQGHLLGLDLVRGPEAALVEALLALPAGDVALPDAESDADIARLAQAIKVAAQHRRLVIRSAATLAAQLAGVASRGLLERPVPIGPGGVVIVCGSHTHAAAQQIAALSRYGIHSLVIETAAALADPGAAAAAVIGQARDDLRRQGLTVITSDPHRAAEHNTLTHGSQVMSALTQATRGLLDDVDTVITKGGITSAEITSQGVGANTAHVLGQVAAGISVWRTTGADGRKRHNVIVPGNVGGPGTLVDVLEAIGRLPAG